MKFDPTAFAAWFQLCATHGEFIANYNRLCKTRVSFTMPVRTPFEALIDQATGHQPMPRNDPKQLAAFMGFCLDMFQRIPEVKPA